MAISALEIGQSYLRAVRLGQKGNNLVVIKFAQANLEEGIFVDGNVIHPDKFAKALSSFLKTNHFSDSRWIVSIPDKGVFTTYKTFPNLAFEDLSQAVEINVGSVLPGKPEEISWGWQEVEPLGKIDGKEVMISSIPKTDLAVYLGSFSSAGIIPIALEPKSLSISRVVGKTNGKTNGKTRATLILDFEGRYVTLAVTSGGFPRFSREFTLPSVEKDQYKTLLAEVRRAMNFYLTEKNEDSLESIILDGPGATAALGEALKNSLNLPVKFAREIYKVSSSLPSLALFGAGIRTLIEPGSDNNLSLLPVGTKEAAREKKVLLFYGGLANIIVITSILFLILFFATWGFLKYLNQKADSQLLSASGKEAALDPKTRELKKTVSEYNSLLTYEASLEDQISYWSPVLTAINNAKGDGVTLSSFDFPQAGQPITMIGVALNGDALSSFRNNLQNLNFIESVLMPSSASSESQGINFTITCNLKKDALNASQ